jgi:hypothetical protein
MSDLPVPQTSEQLIDDLLALLTEYKTGKPLTLMQRTIINLLGEALPPLLEAAKDAASPAAQT